MVIKFRTDGLSMHVKRSGRRIRLVDACLMAAFILEGWPFPGLPVAIPISEVSAIALVAIAVFRQPLNSIRVKPIVLLLILVFLLYLAFGSIYNDVDWIRRFARIVLMLMITFLAAQGRIHLYSGLTGLIVALTVNVVLFYAGLAPDTYNGVLTGFINDKNVAGLYYCMIPLLFITQLRLRRQQLICLTGGFIAVFLTGSRTTLAAFACALVWLAIGRRLNVPLRLGVVFLLNIGISYAEANLAQTWIFSNRAGSDDLRARIDEAASLKTSTAPWFGLGLGEGNVSMEGKLWFFHDSYLALLAEGGYVMLVTVVAVYIAVGLRLWSPARRTEKGIMIEAATIALLVVATKLGEVFLAAPGFLLLALAFSQNSKMTSPMLSRKNYITMEKR